MMSTLSNIHQLLSDKNAEIESNREYIAVLESKLKGFLAEEAKETSEKVEELTEELAAEEKKTIDPLKFFEDILERNRKQNVKADVFDISDEDPTEPADVILNDILNYNFRVMRKAKALLTMDEINVLFHMYGALPVTKK